MGAPLAYSVTLECFTEAHPSSLNYWTREDGQMIHESRKYHTENIIGEPAYKTHMRITINNIQQSDYGVYKCVAKNPRGETDGTIRLYSKYNEFSIKLLGAAACIAFDFFVSVIVGFSKINSENTFVF